MSLKNLLKTVARSGKERTYAHTRTDGVGFRREKIVKGKKMKTEGGGKVFICGEAVGEEELFAITDETWLAGRGQQEKGKRRQKRWRRWISVEVGAGEVSGFDSFVAFGEFALGCLAVGLTQKNVSMFVDFCVLEVNSSETADVVHNTVREVDFDNE